jgi:ATP-binding cassette subfamily B protein
MLRWCKQIPHFAGTITEMVRLAWQAQPTVFVGILLLTALQGALPLATAWLTKMLFDLLAGALTGSLTASLSRDILPILIAQAILLILNQMTIPATVYLEAEMGRRLTVTIQSTVYKKMSSFVGMAYFETPGFYDTFRLASRGAQYGPAQSLNTLTTLFQNAITLTGFLGALVAFNPLLAGLVGLAALPKLYMQMKVHRQRFSLAFTISPDERRTFFYGYLLSGVEAAKEIRMFGLADYLLKALLNTYEKIHGHQRSQEQCELRSKLSLESLSTFVSSMAFMIVVLQAFASRLSLGDVTLYTNAIRSIQGALSGMVSALSSLSEHALFFTHYKKLMSLPQPVRVSIPGRSIPTLASGIELRNLSFRYNEQHPWVLRKVNLYISAGSCLALVGLNGAGKTTLVKLLTRLYDPTEGQILWDGIDIGEFDPAHLRQQMGVIFQDFMRYDLTAQENIGLGDVERVADIGRVRQAAQKASVHTTIEGLPHGYQTMLSRMFSNDDSGVDLSGGEWQKIAIARMYMRSADLLILDEPTAALDAQAEYEMYNRFIEVVKERTCLLISHRFSTVRMADVIAVLDGGRIVEYGSHDMLLSQGGIYAGLYNIQAERYRA